jgi:hypothetical protein
MNWQPIETAPRDGTHILVLMEDAMIEAWWDTTYGTGEWDCVSVSRHGCGCCSSENDEPTHWMPLPARPSN